MQKPNGYDEVKVGGDYTPPEVGGHTCVIKQLKETTSKTGKPMVIIYYDFDEIDSQAGYFAESFRSDIRPEKKWPYAGTAWIVTENADGQCSKKFKRFVNAFEKSNGCTVSWGKSFEGQFKNKKIGAVFGKVESEYDGRVSWRNEMRWFCEYDKAQGADIPDPLPLDGSSSSSGTPAGFTNVPQGMADEDLPF